MLAEVCTPSKKQCEENLAANSVAARRFFEDMELSMVTGAYAALKVFLLRLCLLCLFLIPL